MTKPKLTKKILSVLLDCFNAAEAGGFEGDTQGISEEDAEATQKWLYDCKNMFGKMSEKK